MSATKTPEKKKRDSFVARESKTPTLEFSAGKKMSYRRRLWIVAALVLLGFGLQVVFLNAFAGVPFLIAALVLTWVRGFDNQLDHRRPRMNAAWEVTETKRIQDILTLDRKMRSWDDSLTDISSPAGGVMLVLALIGIGVAYVALRQDWPAIALIVAVDGALLIVPQWFNGMRTIQTRGDLVLKATHVKKVLALLDKGAVGAGVLKARMHMTGRDEERSPDNFKLVAGYPDGPEGFHGVQAQVVINRVQGRGYPYFYACLVCEEGKGLLANGRPASLPSDVIVEMETKDDVDVIIIRQHTTKTSGYHTSVNKSVAILETALQAADGFASRET